MSSNGSLYGKVGIVTGAASGIGRAAALACAVEGARVVVSDVDEAGGNATVKAISNGGGEATFVRADVSSAADAARLVESTMAAYARLDFAFNNAGIEGVLARVEEYPTSVWDRVLAVNLTGVWLCMREEIPAMRKSGGGSIVNCASVLGLVGFANAAAYTVAKHGLLGLTKVAAIELAPEGIRVNAVCPGFIETPMVMERGVHAGKDRSAYEAIAGLHPMNRLGKPEEIAGAVVWLCSDAASFTTAQALGIDGGYLAR